MSHASNLGYGNRSPFISSSHINASNVHDPAALTSRQIPEHGIFGVTSNVAAAMKGGGGREKIGAAGNRMCWAVVIVLGAAENQMWTEVAGLFCAESDDGDGAIDEEPSPLCDSSITRVFRAFYLVSGESSPLCDFTTNPDHSAGDR